MKNRIPEIIHQLFFGISGWKNDVCYYYRFMLVRPEIVNYEIIKNFFSLAGKWCHINYITFHACKTRIVSKKSKIQNFIEVVMS